MMDRPAKLNKLLKNEARYNPKEQEQQDIAILRSYPGNSTPTSNRLSCHSCLT